MTQKAQRFRNLPEYLFSEIDRLKIEVKQKTGLEIIDLSKGSPDQSPPACVIDRMIEKVKNPSLHGYPVTEGIPDLRLAVTNWYKERYRVDLDPETEVLTLIGTREGIAHLPLVYLDPGDISLIPDPGYPTYSNGTLLANGLCHFIPLTATGGFIPDLDCIEEQVRKKAKLLFLNYPNNPTAALAKKPFFEDVVDFAKKNDILVCHDLAYADIVYDGCKSVSFLEVEGAKDIGIEFYSLSKTYNMAGWRIGFVVGNRDVIRSLANLKGNIDAGVFKAIQYAAVEALTMCQRPVEEMVRTYQRRRDTLLNGLNQIGWKIPKPRATIYVWAPVPDGYKSDEFAKYLLKRTGIVVVPGTAYGKYGEGYLRMALVVNESKLEEAVDRVKKIL